MRTRSLLNRLALPPHIGWPLLVVSILGMSVTAMGYTIWSAVTDNGAQVVVDYYAASVSHDEVAAMQAASDVLGWTATVSATAAPADGLRAVRLVVTDSAGMFVGELRGTVRFSRPHRAEPLATLPLTADVGGAYTMLVPMADEAGLWDATLDAARGEDRFLTTVRFTVPR